MTPEFNAPWAVVALVVIGLLIMAAFSFRTRSKPVMARVFKVTGHPITPALQALLGPYGQGTVTGIVQLNDGLQVTYDNERRVTFVPTASGGAVKDALGQPAANIDTPAPGTPPTA